MEDRKFADGGYIKIEDIMPAGLGGFNIIKVKQKDMYIEFRDGNILKRFEPQEDITMLELNKVYAFVFSNMFWHRFDSEYYIKENGLERHFVKVEEY